MSKPNNLKLVESGPAPPPPAVHRTWAAGLAFLLVSGAATWLGADPARRPLDSTGLAKEALRVSMEEGAAVPEVTKRLRALRAELAREPLDSKTRVLYAGLLLGLSQTVEETRAAAFHASTAAELAPATVPVQRRAALVLARCGDIGHALQLTRRTFLFDPAAGSRILEDLLPLCGRERAAEGIPNTPGSWTAWSEMLERSGERKEANDRMIEALRKWPHDPGVIQYLAARAWARGDFEQLRSLFPEDLELSEEPNHALLFSLQAIARAASGDRTGVERSVQTAMNLLPNNPSVLQASGDAWAILEEPESAARLWNRGLYSARTGYPRQVRIGLLLRLARMEEEAGRPVAALDHWRKILELAPDHQEARCRVDELTGFRR